MRSKILIQNNFTNLHKIPDSGNPSRLERETGLGAIKSILLLGP